MSDTNESASTAGACYRLVDGEDFDGVRVEQFDAQKFTASAWDPSIQHGGPVAALLTRALERCAPTPNSRLSRITVDLLGPVPYGPVSVSARVIRPGRKISLLSAVMKATAPNGLRRPVATATAWRMRTAATDDVQWTVDPPMAQRPHEGGVGLQALGLSNAWELSGFTEAVRWAFLSAGGDEPGQPTESWMRLERPLVAGEKPTPLQAAIALADTINGLGSRLDPSKFLFLNTEMTLHLHRAPEGDWFGFQAESTVGPDGIAMSSATIHSEDGPIGRITQNVLVERRG